LHNLYDAYPDWTIDVEFEQQQLKQHDLIVLQFPLQWYSVPPLLKKWMDDVLTYGFAFGASGTALKGKDLCQLSQRVGYQKCMSQAAQSTFRSVNFFVPSNKPLPIVG
jgi:glutathione-regulated potassium-efflux system ancillary protein KefG